jgi:hypothetical protein
MENLNAEQIIDIQRDRYKRKCPFCGEIGESHCLVNIICKCGAKYYYESDIWKDRKTGKEVKGDLWNLTEIR